MARDAASVDIEEDILFALQGELEQLRTADSQIYPPLHEMIEGVISWIGQRANDLVKREFQHYSSCWTGDKASTELQEAGISQQFFRILQECTIQAIKAANDAETEVPHLSGMSVMALEGLVSSLCYFFSGNGSRALDYQLVLQRYIKRDSGRSSGKWTQSFSLWCMNPAVSFTEIADLSMSVILTSGTLSPMSSFSSELGVKFETCMEAPHVIDVESQLWAAVVSAGPGNYPLNASYKTADGYDFQDALGTSLEEICKIVPGGALVFFPSYSLMEKLCTRWRETGQWCRLNAQKSLFIEPRGHQDDFEQTLKDYYDSIRGSGPTTWKIKRGRKRGLKHTEADETLQHNTKGGSAFLAVCRGKVSEGIDFSDENARVIVIVGIPFPNIHDLKVGHKKTFNDMYKSSKNLLSGNEWYCQQAFRALNQAAGRCIRHRFDYGAIIFMDERYKEDRNIAYVSKWIRKSIKRYSSFDKSLEALQSFFQDVKERSNQSSMNTPKDSDIKKEDIPSMQPEILSKKPGKRKIQRINRARRLSQEVASNNVLKTEKASRCLTSVSGRTDNSTLHKFYSKSDVNLTFAMTNEDVVKCTEDIDGGCSLQNSGQSKIVRIESSDDSAEELVKETPGIHDNATVADSAELSNNENSDSTIVQVNNDLSDHLSFHSSPVDKSRGTVCEGNPSLMVTPERTKADINDVEPVANLSRNLSVNSHTHKRREPMSFSLVDYSRIDSISNLDGKPQIRCTAACSDSNRKIDFSSDVDCSDLERTFLNVSRKPPLNSYGASCSSSDVSLDKRLHLCCSLCTKSLGLPENQFLVNCSLASSSKVHLTSFAKSRMENITMNGSGSVLVVVSDKSSVNWRLCNMSTDEDRAKHDTWCEKDGCVFRTVFCPFCTVSDRFLGLLIIATDAENVHLLNKILFYSDCLEIKNVEASKDMASLPIHDLNLGYVGEGSKLDKVSTVTERGTVASSSPFDKFLYTPDQQNSGGWRTTKSKLRLRKRGLVISSED